MICPKQKAELRQMNQATETVIFLHCVLGRAKTTSSSLEVFFVKLDKLNPIFLSAPSETKSLHGC